MIRKFCFYYMIRFSEDNSEDVLNLSSNTPVLLKALLNKKADLFSDCSSNSSSKSYLDYKILFSFLGLTDFKKVPPLTLNLTNKEKKKGNRKSKDAETYKAVRIAPLRISIKKNGLQTNLEKSLEFKCFVSLNMLFF